MCTNNVATEFAPQPRNVNLDRIRVALFFERIKMFNQLVLRNQSARPMHEIIQNPEFLCGQVHQRARNGYRF